jgi:ATP-dependent Lhr-like helicase
VEGEAASRVRKFLQLHGASYFGDIREGTKISLAGLNDGIAALFWNGEVTNDVFAEIMAVKQAPGKRGAAPVDRLEIVNPRRTPGRTRAMQSVRRALRQVPGWTGRWSLLRVPGVMGTDARPDEMAAAQAQQLLKRYGIVAREFLQREEFFPWAPVATVLQQMEMRGEIRRGYFVEGLSGMQFALPEAADLLRRLASPHAAGPSSSPSPPVLLNACDPANPYGTGVTMPPLGGSGAPLRLSRVPGNYLVFASGTPVLVIESLGARLRTVGAPDAATLRDALSLFVALMRLPETLRPFREIVVEYCDDVRPAASPLAPALRSLGFVGDRNQTMRRDRYQ